VSVQNLKRTDTSNLGKTCGRHMVAQLVEALCYKPECHRFIDIFLPATLWPSGQLGL